MTKKQEIIKLAHFLYELGTLRKTARAHRQTLLTDDLSDNIASHSYRVAIIGWLLAELENANPDKIIKMCLLHDIAETRSNDQNWIHKRYVKVFENEITNDQLKNLPQETKFKKILSEYNKRETLESKIAKDADLIDQILLLKEYGWQGNKEAKEWLKGAEQGKKLTTTSAKVLQKEIISQKPSDWWQNIWTAKRR